MNEDVVDTSEPQPVLSWGQRAPGRRRAAAIYGTIITAAVLASAGNLLPSWELAVAVVVTLVTYWLAEEYASLLGEQAIAGRLPSGREIRLALARSWPMVTASFVPVASLLISRGLGTTTSVAADVALVITVALLAVHAWSAGTAAQLKGVQLVGVAFLAALLGMVMILLKILVTNHH